MIRDSSAARLAAALLPLCLAACGEPTGPEALETGSFRVDFSGAVDTAVTGDADLLVGTLYIREGLPDEIVQELSAVDLTVPDARFTAEMLVAAATDEPQEARYAATSELPVPDDSAFAQAEITRDDSKTTFLVRSGDMTIDRVTGREVFGSFDLSFVNRADGDAPELRAEGEFRATR